MRKFLMVAALLMTTSSLAPAGDTFSFEVNGQRVRITRPSNCSSLSCINISAPGLMDSKSDDADTSSPPAQSHAAAPVQAPAQTSAPAQAAAPAQASTPAVTAPVGTVPPLPSQTASASTSNITTLPAPATSETQAQQSASVPIPNQQVAAAPAQPAQPIAPPAPVQQAAASGPVGIWMTEKNEGKVHVVNCGTNLCGYAVTKSGTDGEQVLINMKPTNEGGWHGRIHDTRGGGTYDSTLAMRGDNKMRVEGCAFGGMFCGGQTWTRVN